MIRLFYIIQFSLFAV